MNKKRLFLAVSCLLVLIAISYYSCIKEVAPLQTVSPCDKVNSKYSAVILPTIMQTYCATINCHDGSGGAPLDLNNYADVKIFFDNGQLKSRVIDLKDMPPTAPLPDSLIKKLSCWMGKGAQNN